MTSSESRIHAAPDPWAHVEPSSVTITRHHEPVTDSTGRLLRYNLNGVMYEHPTVNGGLHCAWEWPNGEAFEFWKDAAGRVVAGPRVTTRVTSMSCPS